MLKVIKTDRCTNLNITTLSDLLEVSVEGPEVSEFCADKAIYLWWQDCSTRRRVNQSERRPYKPRNSASSSSSDVSTESVEENLSLDDWDTWMS